MIGIIVPKNLVDFHDVEHFALEILTGGSEDHIPGPVADELSKYYEEILEDFGFSREDDEKSAQLLDEILSEEGCLTLDDLSKIVDTLASPCLAKLGKPTLIISPYSLNLFVQS